MPYTAPYDKPAGYLPKEVELIPNLVNQTYFKWLFDLRESWIWFPWIFHIPLLVSLILLISMKSTRNKWELIFLNLSALLYSVEHMVIFTGIAVRYLFWPMFVGALLTFFWLGLALERATARRSRKTAEARE